MASTVEKGLGIRFSNFNFLSLQVHLSLSTFSINDNSFWNRDNLIEIDVI